MVLVVLLYLLRNAVVAPFAVGKAQPAIADALGMELEIGGFGGSWFGGLTLEEVQSVGEGSKTPLKSVTVKGLEVDYSLWQLLRGEEQWLKSVQVGELAIALDLDQTTPPAEEEEDDAEPSGIPAYLPPVTIEKLAVELWQGDVHVHVPTASLASQFAEATDVQLTTEETLFERSGQEPQLLDLDLALVYDGGQVRVNSLAVNGIERVQAADLDLRQVHLGDLSFEADLSVMDGRVAAKGLMHEGTVNFDLQASGLQAETLNPWLDLGLRGELQVTADVSLPLDDLRAGVAEVKFGAQQNGWQELELQAIDGTVNLEDGWLSTNQFSATGEGLDLRADGVRLPLFEPLESWNAQGHFSLAVDHLPTWLHRTGVELPAEVDLLQSLKLDGTLTSHTDGLRVQMTQFELASELGNLVSNADVDLALKGLEFQGIAEEHAMQLNLAFAKLDLQDLLERLKPDGETNPLISGSADLGFQLTGSPSQPIISVDIRLANLVPTQSIPELENLPAGGRITLDYQSGNAKLRSGLNTELWKTALSGNYKIDLDLNQLVAGKLPDGNGTFDLNSRASIENPAWFQGTASMATEAEGTLENWSPTQLRATSDLRGGGLAPPENLTPFLGDQPELAEKLAGLGISTFHVDLEGGWSKDSVQPIVLAADFSGIHTGNGSPFFLELALDWADSRLKLSKAKLYSEEVNLFAEAELPFYLDSNFQVSLPEEVPLNLSANLKPLDLAKLQQLAQPWAEIPELSGNLEQLGIKLGGTWTQPELHAQVKAKQVHLPAQDGTLLPDPADFDFDLRYADGVATLHQLHATAPQIQLEGGGTWTGELNFAELTSGGELEPGVLDLHGKLDSPDLTWLAATGAVRRAEGGLSADWKLTGDAVTPTIAANWVMQNGALRLNSASTAAMENLHMVGSIEDGLLTLAHMEGDLGSAPFVADGTVDLRDAADPNLDINLNGTDLLLFRQQGVKLRSDANLHIHGLMSALKVEGDIELTDGRYTKPVDFFLPLLKEGSPPSAGVEGISLFSLAPPLDNMSFDVAVQPGSGFRVKTNVANGLIEPQLKLVGTGEVPYLLGEVYIDQFLLSLPANNIRIERGAVRFLEENPFVPTLDIRAGYRRYGYDVTILIHGDLSAPEVTMSSIPPLQAEELLLLTTTGQPPTESTDAEAALGTVAVYLAKDWIRRFFGDMSTEAEESMLDRLEIEFGRDATQQGAETIEGRFLLREHNFRDNDALYLTGERDAYGDFNLGLRIRFLFP